MNETNKALRLAAGWDQVEHDALISGELEVVAVSRATAAELRRLAAIEQERDELAAKLADGWLIVPREIVANYRHTTQIPRHKRICEELLAAAPQPTKE